MFYSILKITYVGIFDYFFPWWKFCREEKSLEADHTEYYLTQTSGLYINPYIPCCVCERGLPLAAASIPLRLWRYDIDDDDDYDNCVSNKKKYLLMLLLCYYRLNSISCRKSRNSFLLFDSISFLNFLFLPIIPHLSGFRKPISFLCRKNAIITY